MSLFKHKPLLDEEIEKRVAAAIAEAEKKTTGEIRVFVESHCEYVDPMDRAKEIFTMVSRCVGIVKIGKPVEQRVFRRHDQAIAIGMNKFAQVLFGLAFLVAV